jgi:hypothetical protein
MGKQEIWRTSIFPDIWGNTLGEVIPRNFAFFSGKAKINVTKAVFSASNL